MAAWWWLHLCIIPHRLTLWKVNVSAKKNMFAVLFLPSGATNGGCVWGGLVGGGGAAVANPEKVTGPLIGSLWQDSYVLVIISINVSTREKDTLEWVETLICYSCVYNFWFCCTPPLFCFWCSTPIFWPLYAHPYENNSGGTPGPAIRMRAIVK